MKIHTFSPEGGQIIDYISGMSLVEDSEEVLKQKIISKIGGYERYLKIIASKPDKHWRKQRSELAIFFSYCMCHYDSNGTLQKNDSRTMIECFQKIKSGEALKDLRFINVGLNYGMILLNDEEIKQLIENNKK